MVVLVEELVVPLDVPVVVPLELDPAEVERRVVVGEVFVRLVVVVVVVVYPGAGAAFARSAADIESRVAAFLVASDRLSAGV
ncbi:MAG TPA: hypothetical protein VII02_09475 [Gemmatimonadaceae bacterium]|jgi:hypothetical protein